MQLHPLKSGLQPVWERIAQASHLLVLLDFDGTLLPLQDNMHAVQLPPAARDLLVHLKRSPKLTVAVLSGRSIEDLMPRIGLDGLVYAGNHGNEIRGRGLHFVEPFAFMSEPALRQLVTCLSPQLDGLPHV